MVTKFSSWFLGQVVVVVENVDHPLGAHWLKELLTDPKYLSNQRTFTAGKVSLYGWSPV